MVTSMSCILTQIIYITIFMRVLELYYSLKLQCDYDKDYGECTYMHEWLGEIDTSESVSTCIFKKT